MKKISSALVLFSLLFFSGSFNKPQSSITGAWHEKHEDDEAVMICVGGYFVVTEFNQVNTQFSYSGGGECREKNGGLVVKVDFASRKNERVYIGQEMFIALALSGNKLTIINNDSTERTLTRVDDGSGVLAGVWRLASRTIDERKEVISKNSQKTLKILSGKRFQNLTFDNETKEHITSNGGGYSWKDGKYQENIEFFAKNPYKIGTSVSYTAEHNKNVLRLKSVSSKDGTVLEEWIKTEN